MRHSAPSAALQSAEWTKVTLERLKAPVEADNTPDTQDEAWYEDSSSLVRGYEESYETKAPDF